MKRVQFLFVLCFMVGVLAFGSMNDCFAQDTYQLQNGYDIPMYRGYVHQSFSLDDYQGKLVFRNLKLDPAYEGFLTVWTRGEGKRIIIFMNKSVINIQVDLKEMKTVLEEKCDLLYPKTVEIEIADGSAVINLGGKIFRVPGITAFSGNLDSIGISGHYDVFQKAAQP